MIIGDEKFSLDYFVSEKLKSRSMRALGWFGISIDGYQYGIRSPAATALGCSFDSLKLRLLNRGKHTSALASKDVDVAIEWVRSSLYLDLSFGTEGSSSSEKKILDEFHANNILMAPDGDSAFDDGAHVMHFDLENNVRLVGFINDENPAIRRHSTRTVTLPSAIFYSTVSSAISSMENDFCS